MTISTIPLFPLGQVAATPGALEVLDPYPGLLHRLISRHVRGDWGDLDAEDHRANNDALKHGSRIFSAYLTPENVKIWVITEADRSATTLLLPEEY